MISQPFAIRTADAALSDMASVISKQIADRIAAEDAAWTNSPNYCRRIDAGHRCLLVDRDDVEQFVPLCDLTEAELDDAQLTFIANW